jgi:predicted small lipoprotein YifL
MTMSRLFLTAAVLSLVLAACGVRGDPKPLDPATEEEAQ